MLVAVLIPLLFMGDIVGRLFREFCGDSQRYHRGFRYCFFDADTDDVCQIMRHKKDKQEGRFVKPRTRISENC